MKNLNMVAAALAFLGAGANVDALDKVAPRDKCSNRQRQRVVSTARSNLKLHSEEQQLINRMTNWQRNQWNRAGSPMGKEQLEHYAALKRAA